MVHATAHAQWINYNWPVADEVWRMVAWLQAKACELAVKCIISIRRTVHWVLVDQGHLMAGYVCTYPSECDPHTRYPDIEHSESKLYWEADDHLYSAGCSCSYGSGFIYLMVSMNFLPNWDSAAGGTYERKCRSESDG